MTDDPNINMMNFMISYAIIGAMWLFCVIYPADNN